MSFFTPNGPLIPGSANLSSATVGTNNVSSITNQDDVSITTVSGTVKMTIGTTVYLWPTNPPPGYNYVLGVDNIQTVDGVTTYTLGWVFGFICFHVLTKVTLENGTVVTMDQLKYGDKVLAVDDKMNFVYSEIVDFTGVFPKRNGLGIKIYHKHGTLIVSDIHLVYADGEYKMAKDLEIGMDLLCKDPKTNVTQCSKITHLEKCYETGWYTPLTKTGTIVAENVVASVHTTNTHNQARVFYKPLHLYLRFFPKKVGEFPKEEQHWYSIKFRRGMLGKFLMKVLSLFVK